MVTMPFNGNLNILGSTWFCFCYFITRENLIFLLFHCLKKIAANLLTDVKKYKSHYLFIFFHMLNLTNFLHLDFQMTKFVTFSECTDATILPKK